MKLGRLLKIEGDAATVKEETLTRLMAFKQASRDTSVLYDDVSESVEGGGGSKSDNTSDVSFWIKGDVVMVEDVAAPKRDGHYFLKSVARFEGWIARLERKK